jgi:PAS domain S-box-containing protein
MEREVALRGKKEKSKTNFILLECCIIVMAIIVLGSLEIVNCMFFDLPVQRGIANWLFGMALIIFIVHFSFRQVFKIQEKLVLKHQQTNQVGRNLQHIMDNSADAIFAIDLNGKPLFANRALERITGFATASILKMNFYSLVAPEDSPNVLEQLRRGMVDDLTCRLFYFDLLKPNGGRASVEVSFTPLSNKKGQLIGFQGVARDLTAVKEKIYISPIQL